MMNKDIKIVLNDLRLDANFNEASRLLEGKSKLLDTLLNSIGDGLTIQDRNMRIVYQNKFMIDTFGQHVGEYCYRIYENRDEVCDGCPITESFRTGKVTRALRIGNNKDGERFRFENIASVLRNDQGEIVAGVELVRLVEDRERALDELREAVDKLMQAKAVYEHSSEGIMVMDYGNRIVSVNPAFESITGYSAEDVIGGNPKILGTDCRPAELHAAMWRSLNETGTWHGELWNRHKDGHAIALMMNIDTIRHEDTEQYQRICIFTDITEKKLLAEQIEYLAQHDALTNLPNRILFANRLEHTIAVAKREKSHFVLLYLDLDHFKPINDRFGHTVGDTLLQLVARRMCNCTRESDTVARMGGDEFAVLLAPIHSRLDALIVAEKLRTALESTFEIEGNQLDISCSIGGAFYPEDGSSEEVLTRSADQAMYIAKRNGRNKICFTDVSC